MSVSESLARGPKVAASWTQEHWAPHLVLLVDPQVSEVETAAEVVSAPVEHRYLKVILREVCSLAAFLFYTEFITT